MANDDNVKDSDKPSQQFRIMSIYLKDASFEAPDTPASFPGANGRPWEPKNTLQVEISHRSIADNVYELVLQITATTTNEESTAFLAEIHQAGLYEISGYTEEQLDYVLSVGASQSLFPYAREAISSMVLKGGFPALILAPIDFAQIYQNRLASAGAAEA